MKPLMNDEKIYLRALEPEDLDILFKWENDTRLWNVGAAMAPFSRKQLKDYIDTYDGNIFSAGQLRLMIVDKESGSTVGALDLYEVDPVHRRAFVGILIDESYRGKGYGGRALNVTADYCRRILGLHQLAAIVPEDNTSSRQLFASAGFTINGRFRSWLRQGDSYRDAFFCQRLLTD